ncbi:MAG TPA: peroxiredoxin-like family protein [Burkholderiales bacterium]|nr:peroxiredoxin-like family protein [Burkholderiales bacterium]
MIEESPVTLKKELDARRAQFLQTADPAKIAAYQRGVDQLAAAGIAARAVGTGDAAPDFTLPNARGEPVTLSELLANGPVVLAFYRGGWCPYCNLQLRAYQRALPELRSLGASLVAVSPEAPDKSLSTAQKNALEFEVLSDVRGEAGRAYRLLFELSDELKTLYAAGGNDLARWNADGEWHLPMPATYVIGADGRVALAYVDAEYRNRLEPAQVLSALRALPS